jgi:hypothetical protein
MALQRPASKRMINRIKAIFAHRQPYREQPLPDYGLPYFDNLYGEYRSLLSDQIKPEAKAVLDEIITKRKQHASLSWNDLYTFDLILARHQPPEKLSRIAWNLRSRYRDIAGLQEYEAYLASKPPELIPTTAEKDLRADIEYLLGQIHLRYAMSPVRENIRDGLSRVVAYITLIGLIVIIIFTFFVSRAFSDDVVNLLDIEIPISASTLNVVLFVGAMGGLVSIQQRFQSVSDEGDPINSVSELARGWFNIFLSAISGAIFAAVLFLAVGAGLLAGDLFPHITSPDLQGKQAKFIWFLQNTEPDKGIDYAKLLIWSFIAGFAERFVPDALSRFVARKETADSGTKV